MSPTTPTPHTDSPEVEITHHGAALSIEAQFVGFREHQIREICKAFGGLDEETARRPTAAPACMFCGGTGANASICWLCAPARSPEKTPERGGDAA